MTVHCPLDGSALEDLPDPLLGTTLGGRYLVVERVGVGGMATVYRARREPAEAGAADVAVKLLANELARDPLQRARFLREARATHRVKHPNIVDVLDYGADGDAAWLVMELLEGTSLAARLARGPVPPREAVAIVAQVAAALRRAHEVAIVHRDVKPENVFLCRAIDGIPQVKVLDFGLAHVPDEARLTASGAVFGTPEYMSPEMARGVPCSPASDLYALGVTFFEMLTARRPFDGTLAELIEQHLDREAPSLREVSPGLPEALDPVVRRLLAKDPAERYRDACHLCDDLAALLAALPADPPRSVTLFPPAARAREVTTLRVWSERAATLRAAAAAAYPGHEPPPWVRDALGRLEAELTRVRELTGEVRTVAAELAQCEADAQRTRSQIGRALDALCRDESAVQRELDALARRRAALRTRGDIALADLLRAWGTDGAVAEAVPRARAWQSVRDEEEALAVAATSCRRMADDLAFQLAQLRGRLAAADAASERDDAVLRSRLHARGSARAAAFDATVALAVRLADHLRAVPAARSLLETEPSAGRTQPAWGPGTASGAPRGSAAD